MFGNIGGKIKGLAVLVTVIGILGSIVGGIVLIVIDDDMIPFGVILMIAGSLVSWVSSFLLYGFGQLVENSDILAGRVTLAEAEESIGEKMEKYRSKVEEYRSEEAEERKKEAASIESRLTMLEKLHTSGAIDWEAYQSKYAEIMKEAGLNEEE